MRFLRSLLIALVGLTALASAQTYTSVTGTTVRDGYGNLLSAGTACFTPLNSSGVVTAIMPSGGSPSTGPFCTAVAGGAFSTPSTVPNLLTAAPTGLTYQLVITNVSTQVVLTISGVVVSGTSWTFDGYLIGVPIYTAQPSAYGVGAPYMSGTAGALYTRTDAPNPNLTGWTCVLNGGYAVWLQTGSGPTPPPQTTPTTAQVAAMIASALQNTVLSINTVAGAWNFTGSGVSVNPGTRTATFTGGGGGTTPTVQSQVVVGNGSGYTIRQLTPADIAPAFSANLICTTCAAGPFEVGYAGVTSVSGTVSYANPTVPTSASVSDGTNTVTLTTPFTTWTDPHTYLTNTTFTLTAVGSGQTLTPSQSLSFLPRTFAGPGTGTATGATASGTNAVLAGGGSSGTLASAGLGTTYAGQTFSLTLSAQYPYLLLTGGCSHVISVNGFTTSFTTTSLTFTNQYSASIAGMCLYQGPSALTGTYSVVVTSL